MSARPFNKFKFVWKEFNIRIWEAIYAHMMLDNELCGFNQIGNKGETKGIQNYINKRTTFEIVEHQNNKIHSPTLSSFSSCSFFNG